MIDHRGVPSTEQFLPYAFVSVAEQVPVHFLRARDAQCGRRRRRRKRRRGRSRYLYMAMDGQPRPGGSAQLVLEASDGARGSREPAAFRRVTNLMRVDLLLFWLPPPRQIPGPGGRGHALLNYPQPLVEAGAGRISSEVVFGGVSLLLSVLTQLLLLLLLEPLLPHRLEHLLKVGTEAV